VVRVAHSESGGGYGREREGKDGMILMKREERNEG